MFNFSLIPPKFSQIFIPAKMVVLCLGSVHIPASSQGAHLCQHQPTDRRNHGVGSLGEI